ncbi:hypothetical protein AR457_42010 (plasmid) [Streptomyces agglomeratus]|uniref:hypothetical protein n=1 Tax=Streptomyces agglomeratus TaxID=285458 RepID=UPI00085506C5|nr:hypothetical protein [Streptomyces agglomeratus]OEJ20844.1 hypothetical protein AR457_42010 [Streptomyces agglomeratus]
MNEHSPTDPILSHVEPVPGGLYGDQPYEAALADLRTAVAEVSAALSAAEGTSAEQLMRYQQDLNRAQLQLRPDDAEALQRAHDLSRTVRRYLAGGAA